MPISVSASASIYLPLRLAGVSTMALQSRRCFQCSPTAVPPPPKPMTRQRNSVFLPPWLSASRKCASGCHVPPYLYLRVHGTLFCTPAVTGSRLQDPEPVYTSLTLAWLRHPIAFQVPSLPISLPGHTTLSPSHASVFQPQPHPPGPRRPTPHALHPSHAERPPATCRASCCKSHSCRLAFLGPFVFSLF